jgi:hypothetical protein
MNSFIKHLHTECDQEEEENVEFCPFLFFFQLEKLSSKSRTDYVLQKTVGSCCLKCWSRFYETVSAEIYG